MIVPPLAMPGLEFITDPVVREKIGITNRTLVFASKGMCKYIFLEIIH